MAEMRCRNCDTMNRTGAKFCARCGARLEDFTPPAPYELPASQAKSADQPGKPGCLHITANLLAWVCGAAFVVLVCLGLPILNASDHIFDGNAYKEALRQQNVYTRFPDLFAEQMTLSQADLGKEAHIDFQGVVFADWKLIAQELVTPQWVQTQVENLIDEIFAATQKGAAAPELKISLDEVTQRLSGDAGFRIYKQVIQTKRECSLDDFFEILDWMDQASQANLPICNIPADLSDFMAELGGYTDGDALIKDLLKDLPAALPDEIALSDFFVLQMGRVGRSRDVVSALAWACLTLAALALLVTFISPMGRTLKGWLLLWGVPLAAAGLICLVLALLMPAVPRLLIGVGFKGAIAPGLAKVVDEMGRLVFKSSASALGFQAAGMLLLGLVMSGASALLWGIQKYRSFI